MNENRRSFLKLSGAAAAAALIAPPLPLAGEGGPAKRDRVRANGDEERFPSRIASFTKALRHNHLGEVDGQSYESLLHALGSGKHADFESISLGGKLRLVNPQAAFTYALEGGDPRALVMPAAPSFDSEEIATEARELYWQALTRDVPFARYDDDELTASAAADLGVTTKALFRGESSGDRNGPYVSQFLWKEVPYGAIRLVQQPRTATAGIDYLTNYDDWLAVQNGAPPNARHGSTYRYISTARDLAAYVQLDFSYQPFETACLILFGMQGTTDAQRPYKGAPYDARNPYRGNRCQTGFVTFGVAHALDLVARATSAALKACWYQKWLVHRMLRPEEFGGRVHNVRTGAASYPIHRSLLDSPVLDRVHEKHGSWLLPQAYPEAAPIHPSYPSGHAAIAGACATVLKAFFDERFPIDDPVVASADGLTLHPYRETTLTVGGELDKLAANVSIGRNAAGIHWRCDALEGMRLGESIAIALLANMRKCFNEDFGGFSLTRFDGTEVKV